MRCWYDVKLLLLYSKNGIEIVYIDGYKKCRYFILADFIINYKE